MRTLFERLHGTRRVLGAGLVASLALAVALQQQEIQRLQTFTRIQARNLDSQQQLASRAVRHLELLRKYGIPYRYLETLSQASDELDLQLEFMVGLMRVESHFDPTAQSHMAAYGLMQVRFDTAREMDPTLQSYWQLFEPERNIRLGAAYFRTLLDRYGQDYRKAALAYNRGPTRIDGELLGDGGIPDHYYRKILAAGIVD